MTDTADAIRALDAPGLRARLADGSLSAEAVAEAYLARIAAREPEVRAFVWHDPAHVRARARALDAWRAAGAPLGALHGIPVAVKDVIDTAGIPTENGAQRDRGRVPARNAHVVARLLAEGAILMGKSVTTELAFLHPGPTRNPRAPGHTPGGSSSGSAAAVADGMVLAAIGTQTGGSVIRPASFCGVVGFKPSFATGMWLDWSGCREADALAAVIARHPNVERVLCGHLHRPITRRWAGTIGSVCPGVAHQIGLDLDRESGFDIVLEPPAYQLHVWMDTLGLVSHTRYVTPPEVVNATA